MRLHFNNFLARICRGLCSGCVVILFAIAGCSLVEREGVWLSREDPIVRELMERYDGEALRKALEDYLSVRIAQVFEGKEGIALELRPVILEAIEAGVREALKELPTGGVSGWVVAVLAGVSAAAGVISQRLRLKKRDEAVVEE